MTGEGQKAWVQCWREMIGDISRIGSIEMDAMDVDAYTKTLAPLRDLVCKEKQDRTGRPFTVESGEVWEIRYWVRSQKFRPTYEEVKTKVCAVLNIPHGIDGGTYQARQIVTATPSHQITQREEPQQHNLFDWVDHLRPTGDKEKDIFIAGIVSRIENMVGADEAVKVAKTLSSGHMIQDAQHRSELEEQLEKIPIEVRDKFVREAGGFTQNKHFVNLGVARRAFALYNSSANKATTKEGLERWNEKWA